jgi:2,3-bisphosphoglycerate-dependent phosphoglycerate mutase
MKREKNHLCKIYLFRHGQSTYNAGGMGKNKRFTGWKDAKLTPLGIKQAKIIAKKLKNKKVNVAFQTRLSRSKDTLKEVLKYHPECKKIIKDDRMIERSYGKLQGYKHKTIIEKYGQKKYQLWHRSYNIPPPKGESIRMVEKRVYSFIKFLIKFIKKNKVNVAISAHGNSMRPFRRYFEKLPLKKMMKLEMPYDAYFEYQIKC